MSVAWTVFIPKVAIEVPQCPQAVILDAIRMAAIEFCEESLTWKETLDPWFVTPNVRDIDVDQPDDGRIIEVLAAWFEGVTDPLTPTGPKALDDTIPGWRDTATGDPLYFTLLTDEIARLAPHPTAKGRLTIEAALRPTETATTAPDFLYNRNLDRIAMGAKAVLLAMTGVPWSSPGRAEQLREKFLTEARSQNFRQAKGYSRSPIRTRMEYR